MVVPYPAAGLFDAVARVLVEPMRKVLGRPVVIDALLS
jgi:tripartite-type tricarboxylate transporter receptor subunit TctC